MRKCLLIGCSMIGLLAGQFTYADLINVDYLEKKCPINTVERECSWEKTKPYPDECKTLDATAGCRFLIRASDSHGFFGGESFTINRQKYCCGSTGVTGAVISPHLIYQLKDFSLTLLLTLLIELPIFYLCGFKKRKALLGAMLANVISVFLFFVAGLWLYGLLFVAISELFIIIFETLFLRWLIKELGFKKILFAVIVANFVSAVGGFCLVYF